MSKKTKKVNSIPVPDTFEIAVSYRGVPLFRTQPINNTVLAHQVYQLLNLTFNDVNGYRIDITQWNGAFGRFVNFETDKPERSVLTYLDLSTGNMTENDANLLTHMCEHGSRFKHDMPSSMMANQYGFWIPVVQEITRKTIKREGFSKHFATLYEYAKNKGYSGLLFDRDADLLDGFPSFDW